MTRSPALVLALLLLGGVISVVVIAARTGDAAPGAATELGNPIPGTNADYVTRESDDMTGAMRSDVATQDPKPSVAPVVVSQRLAGIGQQEVLRLVTNNLVAAQDAVASQAPPNSLEELAAQYRAMADVRKFELFLSKIRAGDMTFLPGGRGPPEEAFRSLFTYFGGLLVDEDGKSISVLVTVAPGEDQQLDSLVRAWEDAATGTAEEAAGRFNNLPFDERERRSIRMSELLKLVRTTAGPEVAAAEAELRSLGLGDWLVLDARRHLLTLDTELRRAWR